MKREVKQRNYLKVIALFFSISIWFFVVNSDPIEVEKKLPIYFVAPTGMTLANIPESEVMIRLKGPKGFVRNIFGVSDKLKIDLKKRMEANQRNITFSLQTSDFSVPAGVDILEVKPREFFIVLDKQVNVNVPVEVATLGELPLDRVLVDSSIIPAYINVSGPASLVGPNLKLEVTPLNLASLQKDEGEVELKIQNVDPRIKLNDKIKIKYRYITKQVRNIIKFQTTPVLLFGHNNQMLKSQAYAHVVVNAPAKMKLSLSDIKLTAYVNEEKKGKQLAKINVELPSGVDLVKIEPEEIIYNQD